MSVYTEWRCVTKWSEDSCKFYQERSISAHDKCGPVLVVEAEPCDQCENGTVKAKHPLPGGDYTCHKCHGLGVTPTNATIVETDTVAPAWDCEWSLLVPLGEGKEQT